MDELPPLCSRCGAELRPGRAEFYVVRIEALADPSPPIFTEQDLQRDTKSEMERLVRDLRHVSQQEAMDQVYRRMTIHLCNACYQDWIERPAG